MKKHRRNKVIDTPTAQFIQRVSELKAGDLSRLRQLKGCDLHDELDGFDLFTGLWWSLRRKSLRVPRREVAWLVIKLYAQFPFVQENNITLPLLLSRIYNNLRTNKERRRFIARTDVILRTSPNQLEYPLSWALQTIGLYKCTSLDWIKLTDDLSVWHNELVRQKWAKAFNHALYEQNKEN